MKVDSGQLRCAFGTIRIVGKADTTTVNCTLYTVHWFVSGGLALETNAEDQHHFQLLNDLPSFECVWINVSRCRKACHCEEQSDVAISRYNLQFCTARRTFLREIATGLTTLAMTQGTEIECIDFSAVRKKIRGDFCRPPRYLTYGYPA